MPFRGACAKTVFSQARLSARWLTTIEGMSDRLWNARQELGVLRRRLDRAEAARRGLSSGLRPAVDDLLEDAAREVRRLQYLVDGLEALIDRETQVRESTYRTR